jgi:hypothetical protein
MNIARFDFDFDPILTSEKVDSWHLKINDENIREISATPNLMTQVKPEPNPIQKKQRMYVRKAISTLLSHKEISKSSHRELKNACEEALKSLDEQFPINGGAGQNSSPSSPSSSSVSSFSGDCSTQLDWSSDLHSFDEFFFGEEKFTWLPPKTKWMMRIFIFRATQIISSNYNV